LKILVIGGIFKQVWWVGGVSKSAFKAFSRQLCCRPEAKREGERKREREWGRQIVVL
jgi:hypothetical protein